MPKRESTHEQPDQTTRPRAPRPRALAPALFALLLLTPSFAPSAAQTEAGRGLGIVVRAADGGSIKLYDQSYALVVGVSEYTNGWPKLPGVKGDAEAVSAALERHGFQVTLVTNPDATRLDKAFKEFISARGRDAGNRLLFYFAGHGYTAKQAYGEEMGYIVPADAPNPGRDPNGFLDRATSMRQIELYAESIQSKHALFLFDSCFSGSLFALTRGVPESISYKTARHVRQFITSGSADERVPDQSIFRGQFVEALEGEADANRDGYVTGTELGEFLQDRVINYSKNAQHPQYGKIRNPNLDKGDFVFVLPGAPAASAASAAKSPPRPAAPPADAAPRPETAVPAKSETRPPPAVGTANGTAKNETAARPVAGSAGKKGKAGKVAVAVDGKIAGQNYLGLEEALITELQNHGLSVSFYDMMWDDVETGLTSDEMALIDRFLRGVQKGERAAGKRVPYAVVITGTIIVTDLTPYDGMHVAVARVSLKAFDTTSGKAVAFESLPDVRGFGNDQRQARDNAWQSAGKKISKSFIDKVVAAAR